MTAQPQRTVYIADDGETIRVSNHNIEGGSSLTVFGDNNVISTSHSKVHGNDNFVSAPNVRVWGNGNTITSDYASVEGSHNIVTGITTTVVGSSNRVSGRYSKAHGNNNTVEGSNVTVNGNNNNVSGDYSRVCGDNNTVHGSNASARGNNNRVTGRWARASGGINNTVNGLAPEVAMQQARQRLQQQLQVVRHRLQQSTANIAVQINQPQQHSRRPMIQQQIQVNLLGQDERCNDNDDACMLCLDNKAIVAMFCCGKKTACVGCARNLYQGKLVGDEACLNCRGAVSAIARIL